MAEIYIYQIKTPLGLLTAADVEEGLCLLEFSEPARLEKQFKALQKDFKGTLVNTEGPHMKQLQKELEEYFAQKRTEFSVPMVKQGTEFQNKVWEHLKKIPYGETRSYKQQALAIGNLKAIRAVARANGENRIAILIPCHRVIGSSGELVGYAGGLERKKSLLAIEQKQH